MMTKYLVAMAMVLSVLTLSCKDDKKEQQILDQQLETIEATEAVMDSTVQAVDEKAKEVENLLKEIDSI